MNRLRRTAGTLAFLLAALPTLAPAQPADLSIPASFTVWIEPYEFLACGTNDRVIATEPANYTVIVRDSAYIAGDTTGFYWKYRYEGLAPGDSFTVVTPPLTAGSYQFWGRASRNGMSSCTDTTITFRVVPRFVPSPPTARYGVDLRWQMTGAVIDSSNGAVLTPHEVARRLNGMSTAPVRSMSTKSSKQLR